MNASMDAVRLWRRTTVVVTTLLALFVLTVGANAGHETSVASMTGCLSSTKGTLSKVAIGDAPKSSCSPSEQQVHLSGGDITGVTAGTGLQGGATNGAAGLSVNFSAFGACAPGSAIRAVGTTAACEPDDNTTYSAARPLSLNGTELGLSSVGCGQGEVYKWDAIDPEWYCAPDNNTTYSARGPLSLSGTTFGLSGVGCSSDYVWKWDGDSWFCAPDEGFRIHRVYRYVGASNSNDLKSLEAKCAYPQERALGGGGKVNGILNGVALFGSYPLLDEKGWKVEAQEVTTNLSNWGLEAWVVCADVQPFN